jgi:DNA-binding transcriptional MerR regulator
MLRLNLSTRPFYNERGLHLLLGVLALLLAGVTVFNARELLALSSRHTATRTQMEADRARAQDARQRATRLRAELNQDELERVLAQAREANALIDERTFSWTELFNHLETTLPADVMLRSVQPQAKDGRVTVILGVVARSVDDIDEFMERLEATGAFGGLLATSESPDDDGTLMATLEGVYASAAPVPPAPTTTRAAAAGARVASGGRR